MTATQIAVYGTLRKGQRSERLMQGLEYKGKTRIKGATLYKLGWFPGLKLVGDDSSVVVDVFDFPEEKHAKYLPALDLYEGYYPDSNSSLFVRQSIIVDGKETFVYVFNHATSSKDVVPTGDWCDAV